MESEGGDGGVVKGEWEAVEGKMVGGMVVER